jgi:hypothetical protein
MEEYLMKRFERERDFISSAADGDIVLSIISWADFISTMTLVEMSYLSTGLRVLYFRF